FGENSNPLIHLAKVVQLCSQTGKLNRGCGQFNGPLIDFIQSQFNVEILVWMIHYYSTSTDSISKPMQRICLAESSFAADSFPERLSGHFSRIVTKCYIGKGDVSVTHWWRASFDWRSSTASSARHVWASIICI